MGAERAFLGYASTAAQAANTSTGIRVSFGKGDYAIQKLADTKQTEPEVKKLDNLVKTKSAKLFRS
jgi:hypothetical protein